ncbi:Uncharacterised protein [Chlamydia trachomatis]|nr:Uncharacterised protein [Chlamydia trachomatis]
MPCTRGAESPEIAAPLLDVCIGLKSPDVRAKAVMSLGARITTRLSALLGVLSTLNPCNSAASPYSGADFGSAAL